MPAMKNQPTTRRNFIKTTALALPLIASGCAHIATPKASAAEFVSVRNGRFELRQAPHYYVGANLWFGCYLCDPALSGGRQRFIRELDQLQTLGVNNIRLLAGSETSPFSGRHSAGYHAITRGLG